MFPAAAPGQNQMPGFIMRGDGIRIDLQCLLRKLAQKRGNVGPNFFQPRSRARRGFEDDRFHLSMILRYWHYVKYAGERTQFKRENKGFARTLKHASAIKAGGGIQL